VSNRTFGTTRGNRNQPRACFVVVSFEGCWMGGGVLEGQCQAPHIMVDCEVHGLLARVHNEDTGRFIMNGHMKDPTWPTPQEPLTADVLGRIERARTNKGQIFVPAGYKGHQ
jgi:hypothetical protein